MPITATVTTAAAAVVTVGLAFVISWASHGPGLRRRARWLEVLTFLPVALPSVVVALGLVTLAARTPLFGTRIIIVIGFVIASLAYTVRIMSAAIMQVHAEMVEAAEVSGTRPLASMRYIVLPQMRAAVRSCVEPGNAGETHFSRPAQSAITWTLTA